ncbi:hypothetical protein JCM19992_33100 [Thermostilla marina]
MAAVVAVLGLTAFSIGFNIVRYPAVRDTAAKLADAAPRSEVASTDEPAELDSEKGIADTPRRESNSRRTVRLDQSNSETDDTTERPLVSYTWGPSDDDRSKGSSRSVEVQRVEAQEPDCSVTDPATTAWNDESPESDSLTQEQNALETAENAGFVGDRYRAETESATSTEECDEPDLTTQKPRSKNGPSNRKKNRQADGVRETVAADESDAESAGNGDATDPEATSEYSGIDDTVDDGYSYASQPQSPRDADYADEPYAAQTGAHYGSDYETATRSSAETASAGTWIEAYRRAVDHQLTPQNTVDRGILSYNAPQREAAPPETSPSSRESGAPNAIVPLEPVSDTWPEDAVRSPTRTGSPYANGQTTYDRQASIEDVGPLVPIARPAKERAAPLGTMLAADSPSDSVRDGSPVLSLDRRAREADTPLAEDHEALPPTAREEDTAITLVRRLPPLDAVAPSPYAYDAGLSADAPIPYYPATGR